MKVRTKHQILDHARDVLAKEHIALVSGDLNGMEELSKKKIEIMDSLVTSSGIGAGDLDEIRVAVLRNQRLLEETMRGIRHIQERANRLQHIRQNLDTYDSQGQLKTIRSSRSSVEYRA